MRSCGEWHIVRAGDESFCCFGPRLLPLARQARAPGVPDAAADVGTDGNGTAPDGTTLDAAKPDGATPDGAVADGTTPDRAEDARDTSVDDADGSDGAVDARVKDTGSEPDSGDGSACTCEPHMSLDCFFDAQGPLNAGPRPQSNVGLADAICSGVFVPPPCADTVEVVSYDGCQRTVVRATGCNAFAEYIFDASTHVLVGARYNTDATRVLCRAPRWVEFGVFGGEILDGMCAASRCSVVCHRAAGVQFPTCVSDAGPDAADASGDRTDQEDSTDADGVDATDWSDATDSTDVTSR